MSDFDSGSPAGSFEDPVVHQRPAVTKNLRRIASIVIVCVMIYFFNAGTFNSLFQYHPISMALAFVAVMPEVLHAAMHIRKAKSMNARTETLDRHMYFAFLMKTFAVIGFLVIYVNKNNRGKHHFTSRHGQFGVLCVIFVVAQVVLGAVYHYRLGPTRKFPNWLGWCRRAHKYLGFGVLALGILSMYLGMMSHFADGAVRNPIVHGFFALCTGGLVLVTYFLE